jgi:hypothetical protein
MPASRILARATARGSTRWGHRKGSGHMRGRTVLRDTLQMMCDIAEGRTRCRFSAVTGNWHLRQRLRMTRHHSSTAHLPAPAGAGGNKRHWPGLHISGCQPANGCLVVVGGDFVPEKQS